MREQLEALIQQMVEKGIRYDAIVQDFEKCYISRVLERVKGNQSRAARTLGMHRNTLSRKIAEYNLATDFRNKPAETLARGFTGAIQPQSGSRSGATRPIGRAYEPVPATSRAAVAAGRDGRTQGRR